MNDEKQLVLLPEMQFEYALLELQDLHVSKKVKKLINKKQYEIKINHDLLKIIESLEAFHEDSWIKGDYKKMIFNLTKYDSEEFRLFTFELYDKNTKKLIAGELGYIIGSSYTSLSGFSSKDSDYRNWGKLQLVLLGEYLKEESFKIWNLGHPYMDYKLDLGAKIYKRLDFLKIWQETTKER